MAEPTIVFEPYASAAQREFVEEIINRRNVRLTGHDEWHPVAFFVKTDEGEILGGLLGQIWAQWLSISTLAVREPFRGRGYGTKLLARAEQYALERGCRNAWLSTFSFQARPLYEPARLPGVRDPRRVSQGPFALLHDQMPGGFIISALPLSA
jgi:GNAT superfamily N-acetyltransferase